MQCFIQLLVVLLKLAFLGFVSQNKIISSPGNSVSLIKEMSHLPHIRACQSPKGLKFFCDLWTPVLCEMWHCHHLQSLCKLCPQMAFVMCILYCLTSTWGNITPIFVLSSPKVIFPWTWALIIQMEPHKWDLRTEELPACSWLTHFTVHWPV